MDGEHTARPPYFILVFCKVVAAGVKIGKTGDYSKVTGRIE